MTTTTPTLTAQTVAQAFAAAARRWGERPFLAVLPETAAIYGIAAGELSYASVQQTIERLREQYRAAGYRNGDRVGLLLENRPAFFFHWFALNGLGVSVVPINIELRAAELEYLIDHSEIVLAVALSSRHRALLAAAVAVGCDLIVIDADQAPPPASRRHEAASSPGADAPITIGTECALLYTSGTTGKPKGCILPNEYFLCAGHWYANVGGMAQLHLGAERMLTPLPLTHMNAMACSSCAMIMTGGCLILLDRFHPTTWCDSVRQARATVVHYLGVMPAMLMKAAPTSSDTDHQVRFGFGAGVERHLQAPFEQRFGFPLLEAWAMTETGNGAVVIANVEPRQVGSSCFGRESAQVQVRIVNDQGVDAATDEPGELWVRHAGERPRYGFFAGYLKDQVATDAAWADGWFHTGDIVQRDAIGMLHFIDRRKNVIRRSGENISALEVESVLNQHASVRVAAVAAVPDDLRGDEVLACVVTHEPVAAGARALIAADIVAHSLARLAYFKAPGYVAFVEALPLTASQKIARGELRGLAASLPGRAECIDTRQLKKRQVRTGSAKPGAVKPDVVKAKSVTTQSVRKVTRQGYEGVAVCVPVTVPYVRYSTRSAHWFIGQAVKALLDQSGLAKTQIDGLTISSFSLGPDTAVGVTQHLGLSPRWLDHIPTGGASGVMALRRAARAVQAGDADVVACVAADTNHVDSFRQMLGSFSNFARDATYPYGSGGPNAIFAFITAHYMQRYGATREDFGRIAVDQRSNALAYGSRVFNKPLTMDEYLAARPIAEPIHLFDCVMPCAGAEAFLVTSEQRANDLGLAYATLRGAIERHNAFADDPVMERGGWLLDRDELYAMADAKPAEMDFIQTYDDYPVIVMLQFEDLGFCGKGEGAAFVRAQRMTWDGDFPNNTSGGQLSSGQAGAAGGFLGMTEALRQLTDAAPKRAVRDAKLGLVSGFGMVTYDRCLCTGAVILGRAT
jgi:acyl-CoA synthetase (AMP-forming)/AMP-acid ligase II/acetyl-CoA acetyltransferase